MILVLLGSKSTKEWPSLFVVIPRIYSISQNNQNRHSVMFGKGKGNKVDSRLEGVNIEEHDKKIEEETMRLVEILNEDDGQVPIKILLSVTLVFLACCTLILTPFIIRQFDNLCYEDNTTPNHPIAFAFGKSEPVSFQDAQTYCNDCLGYAATAEGACGGVAGATGRLANMNTTDVDAMNELIVEVMRPLYDEKFWVAPHDINGALQYIQIPESTSFDMDPEVKIEENAEATHQVICVYEKLTCDQERQQRGYTRILVQ
ncbi:Oidioi.mRNA.OKI2018_I69.chr2.g8184.t1.cds [Oikopleura dioica]|uniref:Oidioi.mRNA.OKI2018_I69.chr2.g8184.t1.cds n=1 Tax=Oikopleura dioica TaxID=34765 RepID=A0ABN7T9H3_OIKDI|nr:Oidioi.mRNA.OKI2018_I69.chr2.g8184.t1.cds [Oikopleura dioica]